MRKRVFLMTKNQLIKKLQEISGNPVIVTSSDAEGNSFSELYEISPDLYYDKENREIADEEDFKDDGLDEESYALDKKDFKKCIVLWPS